MSQSNNDPAMSKLDAYLSRQSQEPGRAGKAPQKNEAVSKKRRKLWLWGLLLILGGGFINGVLINAGIGNTGADGRLIGGIMGGLLREFMRLTILIGFLLVLVHIFYRFWKWVVVLFLIFVGWIVFSNYTASKAKLQRRNPNFSQSFPVQNSRVLEDTRIAKPEDAK